MSKLATALFETHGITLESTDVVTFNHNYCENSIVDVVITDTNTGETVTCECFDTVKGIFPY